MELKLKKYNPFNLDHTLNCGQVFRWEKCGEWWEGVVNGVLIRLKQDKNSLFFHTYPHSINHEFLVNYFRLDDDLSEILSLIDRDDGIKEAIRAHHGLRLIRQDPWECLISYIIATNSNIPAIKRRIKALAERFGDEIIFDEKTFHVFPEPSVVAKATPDELKKCGVGYRVKYLLETAKMISDDPDLLEELKKPGYEELREELLKLPGVGYKVADCVSLFAFNKLKAFPVDLWVRRVMYQNYLRKEIPINPETGKEKPLTRSEYDMLRAFAWDHFGEYAGYAQEYLFYYKRNEQAMVSK
ncbi:MAG: 8-oxoguanine DNA glycosylase [Candidatus Syntrophoarchaeum caldarius]|uniref:DNA-(apurinic or apyrimidinic site) lyase n=1 Tax=Candidatus Syntropharchaeum caldarium TaxID=1838285 RepID=A0A1F2PB24_9EURY|nr:MAG: 8-oxoguanine DNA glycosylase [Candidatus Syntrophoarchaeum caldarius]